ncbi:MAG: HD domain-containing phosphohydrolase [Bacillota bacterium]
MRKKKEEASSLYRIILVDDDQGIIDSLTTIVRRIGYSSVGFTNPLEAIECLKHEHFDLLILDYLMEPIHGDEVIRRIREFNSDIYILLLTGHRDIAPPLETIRSLDIQGYCEKSDKFGQLILLIESGIKAVEQMRMIKEYKDGLNKMVGILPEIFQLKPIPKLMESVLAGVSVLDRCKNVFIMVDNIIESNDSIKRMSIYKGTGKFEVASEKIIPMLDLDLMELIGDSRASHDTVISGNKAVFPLTSEAGNTMGVLLIEDFSTDYTLKLIEIYSKQASSAISNAFLHDIVNMKNEELTKTYDNLKSMYIDTVEALRLAVDARDVYTRGHSDRVAIYAVKIGEAFGLEGYQLELLRLGGIFHDIGKIGTADDILFKTEKLDSAEYDEIKKHPIRGARILSAVSMFSGVVPIIESHHERIDGRGYPFGLTGDEIPFHARILSVADAFDAMTSNRLYRTSMGVDEAVQQLRTASGTQFDKAVVEKFIELLQSSDDIIQQIS